MTQEPTKPLMVEEELYEIVSTVKIPNHEDWGGSEDEMSLFDITMQEGQDDEGVRHEKQFHG